MIKLLTISLLASTLFLIQGCVVRTAAVSSNIIETNPAKGNLINISGENCNFMCENMVLNKAHEACTSGYIIQSTARSLDFRSINMIVRCQKSD
jgi:hypothetical protein